jgi:hypothetical protein
MEPEVTAPGMAAATLGDDLAEGDDRELTPSEESASLSEAEPPIVSLTRMKPVLITNVWPSEAHHFTPWLLENARLLSEVLGIDVELEAREYRVGKFSLDIIGREVSSDTPVIVENQFGATDHGHLGQILTYAGGTKPSTIIWIAEQFREEHRAALDWLNAHTEPGIRFFGIRLAAVTLEGAPAGLIAPSLELVVKPNDWEKVASALATAAASGTSPTQELYREFWSLVQPQAKQRGWTNATAPAQNWWNMPAGITGVSWGLSYAQFGCRSELYFGDPDPEVNQARFSVLGKHAANLRAAFGNGELIFDELPGKKGCRLETRLMGPKISDRADWPKVANWMIDSQERLRNAVSAVGGIPPVPTGVPAQSAL